MTASCLHTIFERQVARFPQRAAVTAGGQRLTYDELNVRADRAAAVLRKAGVRPGTLVGLCTDRSADMVVGVLAILKAGGAYVPIDPDYPDERIEFLLRDTGVEVIASVSAVAEVLAGKNKLICLLDVECQSDVETMPIDAGEPDDLAYVIHTSGSTGVPKGVPITHRQVVSLFDQTRDELEIDDLDVWTLFHSISFDFSVWELWGALLHGGRLVVVDSVVARTPATFTQLLATERVTVLSQTPAAFRQLVSLPDKGYSLRLVVFGGERLDVGVLQPWIAQHGDSTPRLVNMYGITEVTVHAAIRQIRADDLSRPDISPIGVPLRHTRIQLRDDGGMPVRKGQSGEILISGPGVARGYLNRDDLTAQRFVELEGTRWYRSGDRGVRVDGELRYLGRLDRQLKIRGYRVEPGEVEAKLLAHRGIATAVVVADDHGGGDVRLLAFVVPRDRDAGERIRRDLAGLVAGLPRHLRPSHYEIVQEIPLTQQGKADRSALTPSQDGVAETVAAVSSIVAEVLGRDGTGADDDLFETGMTSLAFVRLIAMVNEKFGLDLTGAELNEPTTTCLAGIVHTQTQQGDLQQVGG
ncbi:MAG: amino acid adenylation domain-containing protein [Umezawaea sp.]